MIIGTDLSEIKRDIDFLDEFEAGESDGRKSECGRIRGSVDESRMSGKRSKG